jgi:hypothetical protein
MSHSHAWYTPGRDGPLKDFLEYARTGSFNPMFKGYEHYKMLWDEGFLVPDYSTIRLMWNTSRGDEGFFVKGEFQIEGMDGVALHTARPGIHDPRKVLEAPDCPYWEAHGLSRKPVSRKSTS